MTERVDCVVIGAGVVGLACAKWLAEAGREVIVLEAADMIGIHELRNIPNDYVADGDNYDRSVIYTQIQANKLLNTQQDYLTCYLTTDPTTQNIVV